MVTKRTIHVVGTGTIGEPLLGLLLHTQRALEVDEITVHKHTPRLGDRAKIANLMRRGLDWPLILKNAPTSKSWACSLLTLPRRPWTKPQW